MNFSWFNTLSLRKQENTDFSPFERQQLNIKSKLEWPLSEKTNFSLALNHRFLERGGEKQLTSTRLGPSLDYFNEYGSWSLSAEYTKAEYEDFIFFEFGDFVSGSEFGIGIFDTQISTLDEFNSDTLSIAGQWSQLYLDKKLFLLGKVEYSTANTSDDFDYTAQRYTLGLVYNGPSHWTWKLYASSLDVNFREARNFSDRFADSGESLRFSISYELSSLWELVIDVEKSRRTSDIFGGLESDKLLRKFGIQFNF